MAQKNTSAPKVDHKAAGVSTASINEGVNEGSNDILSIHKQLQSVNHQQKSLMERLSEVRDQRLEEAHVEFGFETRDELIGALIGKGSKTFKNAAKTNGSGRGQRITEDTKKQIVIELKNIAQSGDTTQDIATRYNVSVPTVQNIKKANKLVKARK